MHIDKTPSKRSRNAKSQASKDKKVNYNASLYSKSYPNYQAYYKAFFLKKRKTSCLLDGYTVALACPHDLLSKREKGHLLQFYTENPEFQMHQGTSVVELLLYQLALVWQIERRFRTKIDCMPSWREVSLQRMRCTVYLWLPRDQPWLETPWMKTATHRN